MDWQTLKAQLAPAKVDVVVFLPYDRELTITLGTLSYGEWVGVEAELLEPPVPMTRMVGTEKKPNPEDVTYRAELARVNEERAYRRLVIALEKGGTAIPGATLADKARALRDDLDAGVTNALLTFLGNAARQGIAVTESTAATFRKGRGTGAAGESVTPLPDDAEPVRGAA